MHLPITRLQPSLNCTSKRMNWKSTNWDQCNLENPKSPTPCSFLFSFLQMPLGNGALEYPIKAELLKQNLNSDRLQNGSFNQFRRCSIQRNMENESTDNIIMQNNITGSLSSSIHKHFFFPPNELLIERMRHPQSFVYLRNVCTWKSD